MARDVNKVRALLLKVSFLLTTAGTVLAQETRSTIVGRVTDWTRAVVAGAALNARCQCRRQNE